MIDDWSLKWIDAHVHIWTQDANRYPASGFAVSTLEPKEFTPEWLFRYCRPFQVGKLVLVQSVYSTDNSYMLDSARRYPGIFSVVGMIDHDTANIEEKMYEDKKAGVRAYRVILPMGNSEGFLDDSGYKRMFKIAADTDQAICLLSHPDGLSEINRICKDYEDTIIVIDHMARIGEVNEILDEHIDLLCNLSRYPNVYVKLSRFHALGNRHEEHEDLLPLINRVIETFGQDRVMWGSDSPYQVVEESYSNSINLVRYNLGLSDSELSAVLSDTANKVFFN